MDTVQYLPVAATGKVGTTDAEIEQGITAEYYPVTKQTDAAQGMPRCMHDNKMKVAYIYTITAI